MMYRKARAEEMARLAMAPVRPASFKTQSSRSQNHLKFIARKDRGSNAQGFIWRFALLALTLVAVPVLAVLGAIYQDEPLWLQTILGIVFLGTEVLFALMLWLQWQEKVPVLAMFCNRKQTITWVFSRRLRTHHYVFAYKDCPGLRILQWQGEDPGQKLQLAIRFGAEGRAGDGFHARIDEQRKFLVAPAGGRFGPLIDPIRWRDEPRAAPATPGRGLLDALVERAGAWVRADEDGIGCALFDLTTDYWSHESLEDLRRAIAQVTGLPAELPAEFVP